MRQRASSETPPSVALYWDFENLHASLCEARQEGMYSKQDNRFRVQEPLIDIQAVVELAASYGPVAINRAYCNWQYFGRYRDALLQNAVELIQLFPPGGAAKNGADIKLCLDAVEDIGRFGHIGTVVIVSGDSDFMPLSQKIKAAGRSVIGVATRQNTNRHWARSCHAFRYYDNLLEDPAQPAEALQPEPALDLCRHALRLLAQARSDDWVSQADLWQMVRRLDATFEPREHGHANFAALLAALGALLEWREGDAQAMVRLR